ncbi:MAG: FAD:protein FMN transferase [Bacteroidetes bacterium]|nr:FAD:protein FMN transferase [Bacteroidota bacterium]
MFNLFVVLHTQIAVLLFCVCASCTSPPNSIRVERTAFLMGTMAHFVIETHDRQDGLILLEQMVTTMEDVEAEISTWRDSSAFGRFNQLPVGESMLLPERSCKWLEEITYWWAESDGVFDPAVGGLIDSWGLRTTGHRPTTKELNLIVERGGFKSIHFDANQCMMTRLADVSLDAGGFGKGAALDAVYKMMDEESVAWMIDFGGQVAVDNGTWPISLAHPAQRNEAILNFDLINGSLATSGGSERDLIMPDSSVIGHILNPLTGYPVQWSGSVTVWEMSAVNADVLSTILYVMGPDGGYDWAVERQITACFLIPHSDGGIMVKPTPEFEAQFGISHSMLPA